MQEMSTAVQYNLPIKIFILNNQYMGMVRQWQELLHEKNYSESYSEALPDFIKLADSYGVAGYKADSPELLEESLKKAIKLNKTEVIEVPIGETLSPFIFGVHTAD